MTTIVMSSVCGRPPAIVALREVRECLESLGEMLAKTDGAKSAADGPLTKVIVEFIGPGDKPLRDKP
jgi:hypothetical protein